MSNLCPNCGAELFEGGRFCMKCGFPIEAQQAPPMQQNAQPVNQPFQPMPQQGAPQFEQPQPQEQKPRNMTEEFIERRKRERGIY